MTQKEKNKKLILIIFLLLICSGLIYLYQKPQNLIDKTSGIIKEKEKITPHATLEINNIKYETEITGERSVYELMQKLKTERKINFTEKNYIGMGKFIESINGIKNSGNENWIYYVNGVKAEVGVSNYKINNGDIVSWKYEKTF